MYGRYKISWYYKKIIFAFWRVIVKFFCIDTYYMNLWDELIIQILHISNTMKLAIDLENGQVFCINDD